MQLNIIVGDYSMDLLLPDELPASITDTFSRLDSGMDEGVQLGREWIRSPSLHQRCQVAADKLLTALETDNEDMAILSAAYITHKMPGITRVRIDNSGEMQGTVFE